MSPTVKRIAFILFSGYLILTCYTAYVLISSNSSISKRKTDKIWTLSGDEEWNPWGEDLEHEKKLKTSNADNHKIKWWSNKTLDYGKNLFRNNSSEINVEIWAKSAIGLYLWEHILGGKVEKKMNGIWSYGFKKFDNIKFKFRTGPGVIPSKVPTSVQYLVLTLNGRDQNKISFAKMWLDFLPQLTYLRGVAVLLLGDEKCQNDWILPYMSTNKGLVNVTFLVYDSPLVNHENFFQWPLGVATYRNFPKVEVKHLELEEPRPFICNFVASVYENSTRSKIVDGFRERELHKQCIIKTRQEYKYLVWIPNETKESLEAYFSALRLSDLTISPVGQNTECYRIYEALSLGSVPVVEDVMTPGSCGSQEFYRGHVTVPSAPLRLLKFHDAPVIYFSNVEELWTILEKESSISISEKIKRRKKVVDWYEDFKIKMRDFFVFTLKQKLLGEKS